MACILFFELSRLLMTLSSDLPSLFMAMAWTHSPHYDKWNKYSLTRPSIIVTI